MSATTSISYTPTLIFSHHLLSCTKSRKPISFPKYPTSKSVFVCGFFSVRPVTERKGVLRLRNMAETELATTAAAFRSTDGDESVGVFENEAILSNGSLEFHQDFLSGGLESTLNRLSKWLVASLFGVVILWRHDAEALWVAMGSVINAWLSVTLKRIFNQERPISTSKTSPGMPSSHAQSIFFAVMFAILSMVKWLGINELTVTVGMLALACGSYLTWLRVSQQFHTISQVVVGAVLGSIFSILWFWLWNAVVFKAFISSVWIRIVVVLGSAGICLAFLLYMIRHWFKDER